jgi:hypothetical protein
MYTGNLRCNAHFSLFILQSIINQPVNCFALTLFLRVHSIAKKGPASVAEKTIPDLDLWDLWITGLGLWLTEFASSAFKS